MNVGWSLPVERARGMFADEAFVLLQMARTGRKASCCLERFRHGSIILIYS